MHVKIMVAVSAAAAFLAPAVSANPLVNADSAAVRVDDLNLGTSAGRARLESRIARAADAVCGDRVQHIHLALERQATECRLAVRAQARAALPVSLAAVLPAAD